MEIDEDKIDDAVLALLYLMFDRDGRAWKGHDWGAMNRLHEKGFISDLVNKAKIRLGGTTGDLGLIRGG